MLHIKRDANDSSATQQDLSPSSFALTRRMKIKTRLNVVLTLLLGLTLIIALVAFISLRNGQQAVDEILDGDGAIGHLAEAAEIAMLQARRSEKDYLLRYKNVNFIKAREIYATRVKQEVEKLKSILRQLATHQVKVAPLQAEVTEYLAQFMSVVSLYEKRGHIDSGLEGQFRTAAHSIEQRVRLHHPDSLVVLLQMRRHEKDYLLRGSSIYIEKLHQQGDVLIAQVSGETDADMITELTQDYISGFDQLVGVNAEIAEGIAAFRTQIHLLEIELDKLIELGVVREASSREQMQDVSAVGMQVLIVVSVLVFLLGLFAAIWLARSIIRPINKITHAVDAFAAGDLTQRVTIVGTDEISQLAESFNDMTEELQRSIHDMEQFAYVASHDLQEPLRMVASYTELLARRYQGKIDAKADKYIHYASDGARRMQALIDALLTYSRVGTKGNTIEPVDAGDFTALAIQNLKAAIDESHASITVDELPEVMADRMQMVQVMQNLIGNALKYRGEDAPEIHVSATQSYGKVQLSVADHGIGIAPEFHERVFQIFQRLHERGAYEGTGLGLALVKKTIERHGGKIWIESEEGEGSTFFFTLKSIK